MRGDAYLISAPAAVSDEPVTPSVAQGPAPGVSNIQENMSLANKPGSLVWVLLLLSIVAGYYYLYNSKWKEAISKDGILSFIHQAAISTALVVVGINLMNVFLTKIAAMKIPGLSKVAGAYLPLFHL